MQEKAYSYESAGRPHFWSDAELDEKASTIIYKALMRKMKDQKIASFDGLSMDFEAVRTAMESETRLMLLPIDMAIRRVARIDEDRNVTLKKEVLEKLQEEEKKASRLEK